MRRLSAIAAAFVVSAAAPAFAESQASAAMGPFQFTLFDLDPLDGIAPAVVFNVLTYGSQASSSAYELFENVSVNKYSPVPWGPLSAVADTARAHAEASVAGGGSGQPGGVSLSASGSLATFTGPDFGESASFQALAAGPDFSGSFTLTNNTVLVLKGTASASGHATAPNGGYFGNGFQASASMSVSGPAPGGGGFQTSSDVVDVFGYAFFGSGDVSQSQSRTLAVSFTNLSGGSLTGSLQTSVSASGYGYANAVPEPHTYAMLIAGLAAMGFVVRRRI
jgi:hypothetical protein